MEQFLYIIKYDDNYSPNNVWKLDLLTLDEKYRYNNYKYDIDKNKFLQRHYKLQQILSLHSNDDLGLFYSDTGQPILKNKQFQETSWKISLTGSESFFAIFISVSNRIGIDIEFIKKNRLSESLVSIVLHPKEKELYNNMSPCMQIDYFYRLWTEKEAYTKALGTGLLTDLKEIEIAEAKRKTLIKSILLNKYFLSYCILK